MNALPFGPKNSPMTFELAQKLLARPKRWPKLSEPDLMQFVSFASWVVAVKDDAGLDESFDSLFGYVVENLAPGTRRQIVADMGEMLEAFGREHGTCPMNVLRHWLLTDPDAGVVSTAALTAAQVMPLTEEDPLTGPKLVLDIALETADSDRQGAIVTGLVALGEADVLTLVDSAWETSNGDARSDVLLRMGSSSPTVAGIDFLVSRLERAAERGEQGPVGHVVASLVRLRTAAVDATRGGVTGGGVRNIDRTFPSWSTAPGENAITVRQICSVDEIGERIGKRLQGLAAAETYPRLLPLALRAWGIEDIAFVEGVREAFLASTAETGQSGLLDNPIAVEPMPDWDRDDAVLTWGILNPFGPTKVQVCLVPVDEKTRALVYTLHNPIAPVCLLLGTARSRVGNPRATRVRSSSPSLAAFGRGAGMGGRVRTSRLSPWRSR